MTTLLDDFTTTSRPAAERLRSTMAAVRVSIKWLGVRKTLTLEQRNQAADAFGAEGGFLSAGKKLLDTSHPAFKAVTAVRGRVTSLWRALSLPYPEPGVRLIRQDRIDAFNTQMQELREELAEAVERLDGHYSELKAAARQRLGRLFNAADYPESLDGLFAIEWDFPSIEPPDYLRQLNPELYQQECQRVQQRFDEAVRLAEQAFTEELAKLVSHLTERLSGQDDGRAKIFRDSIVENLHEFFERFRTLSSSSNLGPAVRISTGPAGMRVSASDRAAAFCYHRPDAMPEHEICLPRAFLDTCEGKRDEAVEIEWGQDGSTAARWDDGGVPCRASFDRPVDEALSCTSGSRTRAVRGCPWP